MNYYCIVNKDNKIVKSAKIPESYCSYIPRGVLYDLKKRANKECDELNWRECEGNPFRVTKVNVTILEDDE